MAVDVHHRIGANGVEFLLSEAVTGFETDGNLEVNLCSERVPDANIAVVVLGVVFEIRLAFEANLRTGVRGAIITNIHTRTSDPSI